MSAVVRQAQPSSHYAEHLEQAQSVLTQAAAQYATPDGKQGALITQACSLGAEDVVISHLINSLQLDIEIFVLETGRLHPQTLELLAHFQAHSRAPVRVYKPQAQDVLQFVQREGMDAMRQSVALRKACCQIRKMEPLARALAGKQAWITGLRREQSDARADVPLVDRSDARVKINPLANWTWGDVWHYIGTHQVVYNALHDDFFPSIGCQPCTRAISLGEDFRAGRWWWESNDLKECGLHVKTSAQTPSSPA
ncbi:MAG: phosphoadenylyl-sulfate reductase [Burkholderiales bacterium]